MESKELRIGNYVNVPREDKSPFKIDFFEFLHETDCKVAKRSFIGKTEVHPLTWYFTDLKPIPLTEEWLLKFGFKESNLDEDNKCLKLKYRFLNFVSDESVNFEKVYLTINKMDIICDYVHELQNLYFALTKQELIISK